MLEEETEQPASHSSTELLPLLALNEPRAPIAVLSPVKLAALIACLSGDGTLYKRYGIWSPSSVGTCEKRISGGTVADLSRDGMLTITVIAKSASARLTTRGAWFARTAAAQIGGFLSQ
jgi:hypothetical protein